MKILVAVERVTPKTYVDYLVGALRAEGLDVTCSATRALAPEPSFDLVHVQWPEELCFWERPDRRCVGRVRDALEAWERAGTPVVVTRHNAHPHAHRGPAATELYEVAHGKASAIVHLGRPSRDELKGRYDALQRVIPHGHYPHAEPVDRDDARRALGLPSEDYVVLVFGAVRHLAEKRLILGAFRRTAVPHRRCVVPRWHEATRPSWWREPVRRVRSFLTDVAARRSLRVDDGLVPEARVPLFFGAADVVLIPRIDALNSGVLPLAYSFARPVVGPTVGNIGHLLEETGNFTYRPGDAAAAAAVLTEARARDLDALGKRNRAHAGNHWGWPGIARKHRELYEELLGGRGPGARRPPS